MSFKPEFPSSEAEKIWTGTNRALALRLRGLFLDEDEDFPSDAESYTLSYYDQRNDASSRLRIKGQEIKTGQRPIRVPDLTITMHLRNQLFGLNIPMIQLPNFSLWYDPHDALEIHPHQTPFGIIRTTYLVDQQKHMYGVQSHYVFDCHGNTVRVEDYIDMSDEINPSGGRKPASPQDREEYFANATMIPGDLSQLLIGDEYTFTPVSFGDQEMVSSLLDKIQNKQFKETD